MVLVAPLNRTCKRFSKFRTFAARILAGLRKFDHISPALNDLGWLAVKDLLIHCDLIMCINVFILLHEKFLQFDWLREVILQLNLKYYKTFASSSSINKIKR